MTLSQKFFNRKQAQQKANHCSKKKRKGEEKIQKSKSLKKSVTFSSKISKFDFCACPSHNVVKGDAGGKKGKLLCRKRIFDRIKANLPEIQLKKHQNVQKRQFLQNVPGVNGLNYQICPFSYRIRKILRTNRLYRPSGPTGTLK